jgi:hypothetical protein
MNLCAAQGASLYLKLLRRRRHRRRQDDRPFKKIPKIRGFKGNRVIYEDGFYYSHGGTSSLGPLAEEEEEEQESSCYFVQNAEFHHSHLDPEQENIYSELHFPPGHHSSSKEEEDEDDSALSEDEGSSLLTASDTEEEEEEERLPPTWFDRPAASGGRNDVIIVAAAAEDAGGGGGGGSCSSSTDDTAVPVRRHAGTSLVSSPDSGYKSRQSNGDTSYLSSDSSSEEELCKIHVAGRKGRGGVREYL